MKLSELVDSVADLLLEGPKADPAVTSLHYRAQDVLEGGLFIAVPGYLADGHDFIDLAIQRGAAAVVSEKPVEIPLPHLKVTKTRTALARMAARFYGDPSEKLCLVGVTGTNGKTTTSYLIEGILKAAGFNTGAIGTINYRFGDVHFENPVTTPESLDLQRILAEMVKHDVTHVVMEVSSHGLDLGRIERCAFDVGVFTNLTQDHLDYHKTMEAYWECKKRFFTHYLSKGPKAGKTVAVVNAETHRGLELAATLKTPVLTVGSQKDNAVWPEAVQLNLEGISGGLWVCGSRVVLESSLVGRHNLENILCAAGVGAALKLPQECIGRGISLTRRVPGRLEAVPDAGDRSVFVDYAHSPDAIEKVLRTLKSLTSGKLICVFGAGGNRDRGKRPKMGEISGRLADFTIITSDNPRSEVPDEILREVATGIEPLRRCYQKKDIDRGYPGDGYCLEPDREKGVRLGLKLAGSADAVLIAGKGHETYQVMGPVTIPFDDRKAVAKAAAYLEGARAKEAFWTSALIAEAAGGNVISPFEGEPVSRVEIDSRTLQPQSVFVAILGERHDGHRFIEAVVEKGARMLVVREDRIEGLPIEKLRQKKVGIVAVPDTARALGDMAACVRSRLPVSVVAITGSNGKTSTRKMCAGIAQAKDFVLSTEGNLNNEIGLPLTLLKLRSFHQWAVLELGMNHPGEIRRLSEICRPDIAVITNIGPAHLEGVGSMDGVVAAKAEVVEHLHPKGALVLNADCGYSMSLAKKLNRPAFFFGRSSQAHVRATWVKPTQEGIRFVLESPAGAAEVRLPVPGAFMVSNALAAAAVGYLIGISLEDIRGGLESFTPIAGRLLARRTRRGVNLVDDTYNANPSSMKAALDTVKAMAKGKKTVFVAGDMFELGAESARLHEEVGRHAAMDGFSRVYASGSFAAALAAGALSGGIEKDHVVIGPKEDLIDRLLRDLEPEDWVLVKGSRGMAMETVVSALLKS